MHGTGSVGVVAIDRGAGPTALDAPGGVLGFVDDMWMRPVEDVGPPGGPDAGKEASIFVPPGYAVVELCKQLILCVLIERDGGIGLRYPAVTVNSQTAIFWHHLEIPANLCCPEFGRLCPTKSSHWPRSHKC
jgi:hypothetical protein